MPRLVPNLDAIPVYQQFGQLQRNRVVYRLQLYAWYADPPIIIKFEKSISWHSHFPQSAARHLLKISPSERALIPL